ncbi:TonB-dependent receptor [bacterium]|nr:TonB-dependent receptor [bacterium]
MKIKSLLVSLMILLLVSPFAFTQSRETGAIEGTVKDDEGEPLPGVTVTLTSPSLMGQRTFITTGEGKFRFPAIPPGTYTVKAELQGFNTVVQENVDLNTTMTLTVNLEMKPATVEEEVTVVGKAPTVDVKSTETASVTLDEEILRNIPYSNFSTDIVNMAPGVHESVAFGASTGTGIAYQVDGVDVSDPEGGTAWVFLDPNIVKEAKVMGIGLPAEYGNFTGAIFNMVTKSGGNEFSGHFNFIFQGKKTDWPEGLWQAENNQEYIDDFPDLTSPLSKLYDAGAHLGGPIIKDKLWFFVGAQYYRTMDYPTGFPEAVDYKQPRGFIKLTSQLTPSTNLNTFFEVDVYNGVNRASGSTVHPDACVDQVSPDYVGNLSLTHIINQNTFFDLKGSFFNGYYYLDPEAGDKSAHYSINDNMRYESAGWYYYGDRNRVQGNASLTHYAEDFIKGDHDFKFGVEFEHGVVRNRFGFTGPNNRYYVDFTGYGPFGYYYNGPYLAYQYEGYDTKPTYTRVEEYVQDNWKVSDRLNLNIGLRLSHVFGFVKGVDEPVYSNFRLAPRAGFTFDLLGDSTTIFKAHYGHFTEAMLSNYHSNLSPAENFSDYVGYYYYPPEERWIEWFRIKHEKLYTMADEVSHPYMEQYTVGIERELFTDTSLTANFVLREWKSILGPVDQAGNYRETTVPDPVNDNVYTVYEQTNPGVHEYLIKNVEKSDPWVLMEPYQKYWGLHFIFKKRFSNKWQLLASYMYSEATGTVDNYSQSTIGDAPTSNPNDWINAEGHLTNDPTHMIKVNATYILPYGINMTARFEAVTGESWTRRLRTRLYHGVETFFTEDRGSHHYPMSKILDIRLEKTFTIAEKYQLGLMFDVFNVLNDDTIEDWGTRIMYDWYPDQWPSTDGHQLYDIVAPRQARLGIRLRF